MSEVVSFLPYVSSAAPLLLETQHPSNKHCSSPYQVTPVISCQVDRHVAINLLGARTSWFLLNSLAAIDGFHRHFEL